MKMIERYRHWFQYERATHAKVLQSLKTVPLEQRQDTSYQKALELFGHMLAARKLWLHRLGGLEKGPTTMAELFPTNLDLSALADEADQVYGFWTEYLAHLDEAELSRQFAYTSTEGDRYRNRVEDILTQLFGHSWYHRGQIAALVRALGGEPAETDFVFWTRERISGDVG